MSNKTLFPIPAFTCIVFGNDLKAMPTYAGFKRGRRSHDHYAGWDRFVH